MDLLHNRSHDFEIENGEEKDIYLHDYICIINANGQLYKDQKHATV